MLDLLELSLKALALRMGPSAPLAQRLSQSAGNRLR